ncbi:hypothetical protein BWI97_07240 [Siphonobacter sp. BAB-5405]|uniref:hypothetical protein n=1 Tax=Siphonobacter sp. BAB-5405 TaxID=1864825 RepID=UPI000C7F952D|nr:hypothetical protein [Siphonobacter sp. BAB-5405]PMD97417.1 hypothetical protein BWI97_07240 [Siphonobacter sp. BAB-5405]
MLRCIGESARVLPRAKSVFAAVSFATCLEILLEQSDKVWAEYGWRPYDPKTGRGNFVMFKKPPGHWPKPAYAPKKYDNLITFITGYALQLQSYDRPNTNRGSNNSQAFIDEAAWFKEDWVNKILVPSVGRVPLTFDSHLNNSFMYFSSNPWHQEGQWVYKFEELAKQFPNKYYFQETTAFENPFLPAGYLENAQRTTPELEFAVEYLNQRLTEVPNTFYPSLSTDKHFNLAAQNYELDDETGLWVITENDYRTDQVLAVSMDANAGFTSCTVWQETLALQENCIDAIFVKPDVKDKINLVQKLAFKVLDQYKNHRRKELHLYGDRNAKSKSAQSTTTQFSVFAEVFQKEGWKVVLKATSFNWLHKDKHFFIDDILKETKTHLPKVRFHPKKGRVVVTSMQRTPMDPDFTKNKDAENRSGPQELAPHFGDTVDYYLTQKHGSRYKRNGFAGTGSRIPLIGMVG